MTKTAFVFPGQGAQTIGMGQDFHDRFPTARAVYERASEASGLNLQEICFTANDRLDITEYTQAALLTTEVAMLRVILEEGIRPDLCAGLSLGEYAALAAGGVMSDEDLFSLIRKRGIYMQEAYPQGGAMTAVLGLEAPVVDAVCQLIPGTVAIANDNCPGQLVISGEEGAVAEATAALKAAGAKRCIPLKVSGPFHSPLLNAASNRLAKALEGIEVKDIQVPYISNVTAQLVTEKEEVKSLLARQVSCGVRFRETLLLMKQLGVTRILEIGPGKTIAGFVRKTVPEVQVINIAGIEDLAKLKAL